MSRVPIAISVAGPLRAASKRDRELESTDLELFEKLRAGDTSAYGILMKRYWDPLIRYASRIVRSTDAAEDIVQDSFVRIWERRDEWKSGTRPRLLLYTLVRNLAFNHQKSHRKRAELLLKRSSPGAFPGPTPVDLLEERELRAAIDEALERLPERRREVLVLSRFHGLSRGEIAAITRSSPQTVSNHLTLALADLRMWLKPFLAKS